MPKICDGGEVRKGQKVTEEKEKLDVPSSSDGQNAQNQAGNSM